MKVIKQKTECRKRTQTLGKAVICTSGALPKSPVRSSASYQSNQFCFVSWYDKRHFFHPFKRRSQVHLQEVRGNTILSLERPAISYWKHG